ncbi:putative reverse transcriptase domain-containing protein [Tanacetum coccineum]
MVTTRRNSDDDVPNFEATHSIISTTFAKKLNMNPTPLIKRVIISTLMTNHMLIDHEYVNCPLRFADRIRPANLLPIHMLDFDVILGMDWLASHRATIDCYARTVIFGNVRQPEFVYHGSSPLKSVKLISAMKARTLISHGCQGFLASVMDTSLESPNIENLSIVREFADVFPDELPGLPSAREIEFGIELNPGAEPISKAPYRMAPVELKELKEQLQEMLKNGFIRPSVSPWGAPVLFVKKKDGSMRLVWALHPPSVDYPAPEVIAPIHEVVAPVPAVSTCSPSSTNVDQDAQSPSNSKKIPETQPPVIPNDVETDNHDIEVAHTGNDPYFGIPIPEVLSDQSSSSDSIHTIMHPITKFLNTIANGLRIIHSKI